MHRCVSCTACEQHVGPSKLRLSRPCLSQSPWYHLSPVEAHSCGPPLLLMSPTVPMQAEPEVVAKTSPRLWHGTANQVRPDRPGLGLPAAIGGAYTGRCPVPPACHDWGAVRLRQPGRPGQYSSTPQRQPSQHM